MKNLLLVLCLLALAGCSSTQWRTYRGSGISVRYPASWFATSHALTPVVSPGQVLAVASYPLPKNNRGAEGCSPREALARLPADGAFIYGWEYGSQQSSRPPPRPSHFSLTGFEQYECLGPSYALSFREAGRWFQIHISLGPHASKGTRKTVLRILDSFRASPR